MVYSTSFSDTWKAYCDSFKHSLVCVDRTQDIALLVYSYNEITKKISGNLHENWVKKEDWCLEKLTLGGNLPLDVIDCSTISKTMSTAIKNKEKVKKCDEMVEISGSRYLKLNPDKSIHFPTRLVSRNGCYSYNNASPEVNAQLLLTAGFVEHENCVPFLAKIQANENSKTDAEFRKIEQLDVKVEFPRNRRAAQDNAKLIMDEASMIEAIRRPLLEELAQKKKKLDFIKKYTKQFSTTDTAHLRNMDLGTYTVIAARKQQTRFGEQYRMLIEVEDEKKLVWGNHFIKQVFDGLPDEQKEKLEDEDSGFLAIYEQPLAVLTITGRGTNSYGHTTVSCTMELTDLDGNAVYPLNNFKTNVEAEIEQCREGLTGALHTDNTPITVIPRERLVNYREYTNLNQLPIGSVHTIQAIGYVNHYGTERLVVKVRDKMYQAGDDLEDKVTALGENRCLKIEKIRLNKKRRVKYAVCKLFQAGDWSALVDYSKTPMFTKFDGKTCFVDVKSVIVKAQKRKLLLTDDGVVFKLKRSRIEDEIIPGNY